MKCRTGEWLTCCPAGRVLPPLRESAEHSECDARLRGCAQVALRCGAEHMTFSSFIGSFKWDYGRYDAFETTLEVRRQRGGQHGVGERGTACRRAISVPRCVTPCQRLVMHSPALIAVATT